MIRTWLTNIVREAVWAEMGRSRSLQLDHAVLETVRLPPGAVLVLRAPGAIPQAVAERLRGHLEARFPGHQALVLGDGLVLDVVVPVPDAAADRSVASLTARCGCTVGTNADGTQRRTYCAEHAPSAGWGL